MRRSQICNLCLEEKYQKYQNLQNNDTLNSRNELISKCRHYVYHDVTIIV